MTIEVLTGMLLLAALWSVLCRVNQMQRGVTDPAVFAAHLVIGVGLAGGLFLPGAVGKFSMALGVSLYLLAGAWRWRYAAPDGTRLDSAPGVLDTETRA
jgi:hypothetical protein